MAYITLLAVASLLASLAINFFAASLPTISVVGSKFFDSNGNQFYVKGVAYQLTEDDPLIDTDQCTRDAALMKTLGANCIRVYHVDPTANHTGCMAAFAAVGIYLLVDLDTFTTHIYPQPNGPVWNTTQYEAFTKVIDSLHSFDNTLGFFVSNEAIAKPDQSSVAPYIKAAAHDTKAYIVSKNYRKIPIGYSAADIEALRPMLQNYLACGGDSSENIDFFGLNAYEWCGNSGFVMSGYSSLNDQVAGYSIPIFFSETGCNKPEPRDFADQSAIFGPEMEDSWSGAVVYEWIEEQINYGLISYGPPLALSATGSNIESGFLRSGTPTPISPDFTNLQNQWSTLTPTGTPLSLYSPSLTPPACPSSTSGGWEVNGNVPLPTLNQTLVLSTADSTTATVSASASPSTSPQASLPASPPSSPSGSPSASPSASPTKGSTSRGREITGMGSSLVAVMLCLIYWL